MGRNRKQGPKRQVDGHQARKRFGQNFLRDPSIIRRIVSVIQPQPDQHLVEIGPGMGAITEHLLEGTQGSLTVVELDRDLIPRLEADFGHHPGFIIHQADALSFDFGQLARPNERLRLVGNLPYNISTPLIFHLLGYVSILNDMHFMLQKEVVERLAAQPGDSAYGRLGIMIQYHCQVEYLFTVPPEAFSPRPKVDSAIVRLTPHSQLPYPAKDYASFAKVVQTGFSQRRKTLRNNLKTLLADDDWEILDIDTSRRPETLAIAEWVAIADHVYLQQDSSAD